MRILYLSRNIENYKAANYQKEFMGTLSKLTSLFVYGPGYSYFDKNKKIDDIIRIYGPFNIIFVGHSWLEDGNKREIDPWPQSGLSKISHKKFLFLNKEYTNLDKKLRWIKKNKFDYVFSHHQNCKIWQTKIKTQFRYLPFAYDDNHFFYLKKKRKYDLAFSGILQNTNKNKIQSDIRVRIINRLYFTFFNIPLFKRKKYRHLSIFWNSIPDNYLAYIISRIFNIYNFLDIKKYAKLQTNSKVYLNFKSPMNLVSPRYFENIASGCLIITERNDELKKLLPKFSYMEFHNDLSNFDKVLNESLVNFKYSKKKREYNAKLIKQNHSWNLRVKMVLKIIKNTVKINQIN